MTIDPWADYRRRLEDNLCAAARAVASCEYWLSEYCSAGEVRRCAGLAEAIAELRANLGLLPAQGLIDWAERAGLSSENSFPETDNTMDGGM
jgi:hypothetical protein